MYRTEQALVDEFVAFLETTEEPWEVFGYVREFDYAAGRTDVVAACADNEVVAFEAKLQSWRSALGQAYRNKCFAHRSYVVLPASVGRRALRYEAEFRRRGVGMCIVSSAGLVELIESWHDDPSLDWLSRRALDFVTSEAVGADLNEQR